MGPLRVLAAEQRARPGPPSPRVVRLKRRLKKKLRRLVRNGTTENRIARPAWMVLLRADGLAIAEIARRLEIRPQTVTQWCDRFLAGGVDGLRDRPRPGRPRSLSLQTSSSP